MLTHMFATQMSPYMDISDMFRSICQVIVVPLLDGMLGAIVPAQTWFGALMSLLGVAMLESSGSPPSVSIFVGIPINPLCLLRQRYILYLS